MNSSAVCYYSFDIVMIVEHWIHVVNEDDTRLPPSNIVIIFSSIVLIKYFTATCFVIVTKNLCASKLNEPMPISVCSQVRPIQFRRNSFLDVL